MKTETAQKKAKKPATWPEIKKRFSPKPGEERKVQFIEPPSEVITTRGRKISASRLNELTKKFNKHK